MTELHIVQDGHAGYDPYQALAGAICVQAVKDYRSYGKKLQDCSDDEKDFYKRHLMSIRRFFRSDWYTVLCYVDGNQVLAELDKEVFGCG